MVILLLEVRIINNKKYHCVNILITLLTLNFLEKVIGIFKWYYHLFPLFGSSPLITLIGFQTSEDNNPKFPPKRPLYERPGYEDAQSTNISDDDAVPPSNYIFSNKKRGKKRTMDEVTMNYFERKTLFPDSYSNILKNQIEIEERKRKALKEMMQLKRQEHLFALQGALLKTGLDDEFRETIKRFIRDTETDLNNE